VSSPNEKRIDPSRPPTFKNAVPPIAIQIPARADELNNLTNSFIINIFSAKI
jgi:hypothetical protein